MFICTPLLSKPDSFLQITTSTASFFFLLSVVQNFQVNKNIFLVARIGWKGKDRRKRGGFMGRKLFVVEARRLLPLLFLLVLLVSLSVYDTFRTSPTVVPREAARGTEVKVTTVDKGERKEQPTFRLALDQECWAEIAEDWGITLPQFPFQPQHEVALFAMHAEMQKVDAKGMGDEELEVTVRVAPKRDHYQVVVVPAKDVLLEYGQTIWTFVDKKGNIVDQFTTGDITETAAEEVVNK
jgi:hypothetical protein